MQMLKRRNLALLVPVLTILAMGCSNNDDSGESSSVAVTFKTVVAIGSSSFAINTDGKLYTWGKNDSGQLGNGKAGYDANYNHKQKEVTPQLIEVYE